MTLIGSGNESTTEASQDSEEVWYLALRKLLIKQGPGVVPSSIRFRPGQRFALDGDEGIDVEDLIRVGAIKIYQDSDADWAQAQLADQPEEPVTTTTRRRSKARNGKN